MCRGGGQSFLHHDIHRFTNANGTGVNMIQSVHTPQLSSAKPRTGLQSISSLLPRLIDYYEQQAEAHHRLATPGRQPQTDSAQLQQSTFAFYE